MEEDIVIADITGIDGNTSNCELEDSTDFYPIVNIGLSSSNPENVIKNSIIKFFKDSDIYVERCKPFVKEMEYSQLKEGEKYFVPYFRMWPSQAEDRIFKLSCKVTAGHNNCSNVGDIYFELPTTVKGLMISPSSEVFEEVSIESVITLELSLTKDVDRNPTEIDRVPLVFYVLNHGEKTEVGRIHLSIAPKDVFSEAEMKEVFSYINIPPKSLKDDCITAVRKNLEKLLNVKLTKAINYKKVYNMYSLMSYLNSIEHIKGEEIVIQTNPDGTKSEPNKLTLDIKTELLQQIEKEIGFHVYGISWISAYHTALLLINNGIQQERKIQIADQMGFVNDGKGVTEFDYSLINDAILSQIKGWWQWVKRNYSATNAISKLWKITRIVIFIFILNSCVQSSEKGKTTNLLPLTTQSDSMVKMDNDSTFFLEIMEHLKSKEFQYDEKFIWIGNDVERKKTLLGENNLKYLPNLLYYRDISFDNHNTVKPMYSLTHLRFNNDSIVRVYIKDLESDFFTC
jgi:hypothetical protein